MNVSIYKYRNDFINNESAIHLESLSLNKSQLQSVQIDSKTSTALNNQLTQKTIDVENDYQSLQTLEHRRQKISKAFSWFGAIAGVSLMALGVGAIIFPALKASSRVGRACVEGLTGGAASSNAVISGKTGKAKKKLSQSGAECEYTRNARDVAQSAETHDISAEKGSTGVLKETYALVYQSISAMDAAIPGRKF